MILMILAGTPAWVWAVLLALVALGLSQARTRTIPLPRVVALPAAMLALGAYSAIGTLGHAAATVPLYAGAVLLATWALARRIDVSGVAYDRTTRRVTLPGSWLPLALMMAVFALRYAVGVSLALHPDLRDTSAFTLTLASAYGLLSGVFPARALALRSVIG